MRFNVLIFNALALLFLTCQSAEKGSANGELSHVYPDYNTTGDLPKTGLDTGLLPAKPGGEPHELRMVDSILPNRNSPIPNPQSLISLDYLMGKFDPATDERFVQIDEKWASEKIMFLRKETFEAFKKMAEAAAADGILLKIVSATRTFSQQKGIWESKWTGGKLVEGKKLPKSHSDPMKRALKILEFSSMPGTSRHHWGTDIDLNNLSDGYFTKKNSTGAKIYAWLSANAHKFGFCQPYSAGRTAGYHEEKWHWSYTPLSKPLLEAAKMQLRNDLISGFAGAETAVEIGAIEHYVLGVNEACK